MPARLLTGWLPRAGIAKNSVVTIGVFDGVHVAHQQLIRAAIKLAREKQSTAGVITFDPDPQHVLDPRHAQPALMPVQERLRFLASLGVDWIWVIPFSSRVAAITAEQFVRRILVGKLNISAVVVGDGFLFGKDRAGTLAVLRKFVPVLAVASIRRQAQPVSSSRIRQMIQQGMLADARRLLGRAPSVYGFVETGAGRARRLGFPTANIRLMSEALPPQGVYAVRMRFSAQDRFWPGVMNFGIRPTFGGGRAVCEVHLLGFRGRLLGKGVEVQLMRRLRNERCFASPAALQKQVQDDIRRTRHLAFFPLK